jgi:hypothetical protein
LRGLSQSSKTIKRFRTETREVGTKIPRSSTILSAYIPANLPKAVTSPTVSIARDLNGVIPVVRGSTREKRPDHACAPHA